MLSLTKKTDYALIAICHLAERNGAVVSAREIAAAYTLPTALVMNVLKTLHHKGVLTSRRGTKGGYSLAVDLADISLLELIECLEGPVHLTQCTTTEGCADSPGPCRIAEKCPIRGPITALHDAVLGFLKDMKLADIVKTNGHARAGR